MERDGSSGRGRTYITFGDNQGVSFKVTFGARTLADGVDLCVVTRLGWGSGGGRGDVRVDRGCRWVWGDVRGSERPCLPTHAGAQGWSDLRRSSVPGGPREGGVTTTVHTGRGVVSLTPLTRRRREPTPVRTLTVSVFVRAPVPP